jgi:glycerate kinase
MLKTRLLHPEILAGLAVSGHFAQVLIADGNFLRVSGRDRAVARTEMIAAPRAQGFFRFRGGLRTLACGAPRMRVLVALDKFKEALAAPEACRAVVAGLREVRPGWICDPCPLTDGGDGFLAALTAGKNADLRHALVAGPLGQPVSAAWARVSPEAVPGAVRRWLALPANAPLAVVEMAACSGLALVPRETRDVWRASSRGVGELIAAAEAAGAGGILLGVGGSATNDLGLGALAALGFRFLDGDGAEIADLAPAQWPRIVRIEPPMAVAPRLPPIWIACDVDNPLLGPRGATHTYGPQKGLSAARASELEEEMRRMAALLAEACGIAPAQLDRPGGGAAGGITAGLVAGLGARVVPGFSLVSEWLGLEERIAVADLVITGEGRFDATSLQGKGPGGVARLALDRGKRVLVLAGSVSLPEPPPGLRLRAITPPSMPLTEALPRTGELLAAAARDFAATSG